MAANKNYNKKRLNNNMYTIIKRIIDVLFSLLMLTLLSPLFILVVLSIKLDSKGPAFLSQRRVGINRTYFNILKFRTMSIDTPEDVPTHLLEEAKSYITKVGMFLRRTSLDELPQLINVVKGEMALVGPRPALWNQYDLIEMRDIYGANDILPGLTGWAQINGRDELSVKEKVTLDAYYTENRSLWLDFKCIVGTIIPVLKQKGVIEGVNEENSNNRCK